MAFQVLDELKRVLKQDTRFEINVSKTSILPKGTTQKSVFDVTHSVIPANPPLTQVNDDVSLASFCPEGFVGIGVSIGTDAFVQSFVAKTGRAIIDDVEKLDYIQTHILIRNRCVLQQQHVDYKIADTS